MENSPLRHRLLSLLVLLSLVSCPWFARADEYRLTDVDEETAGQPMSEDDRDEEPEEEEEGEEEGEDDESQCDWLNGHLPCWLTEGHGLHVNGWVANGFTWNPSNPADRYNGPVQPNDRANEHQLNQLYLSVGRETSADGFHLGYRAEVLYGTDAYLFQQLGFDDESAARRFTRSPFHGCLSRSICRSALVSRQK